MGMYAELVLGVQVTNKEAIDVLRDILDKDNIDTDKLPNIPHFKKSRSTWMLRCSSFYFQYNESHTNLTESGCLSIRCSLKNYESEIESFLEWLTPFVEEGFLGYSRYEEEENPTLYYRVKGKLIAHYKKFES